MFDEEEASEIESEQVDIHMMDEAEVEQELQILNNGEIESSAEREDPIVEDYLSPSPVYQVSVRSNLYRRKLTSPLLDTGSALAFLEPLCLVIWTDTLLDCFSWLSSIVSLNVDRQLSDG